MIETATSATFKPHVGDEFEVTPQEGLPFVAVLSSCEETPYGSADEWQRDTQRVPFSLIFHVDSDPGAPQQICAVRHRELGEFELFLVPIGPDERGMRYEAVFS
jgi:hypothetical protein